MEVINRDFVNRRLVTDFVGFPVVDSPFGTTPGKPSGESVGVMVAAGLAPFLWALGDGKAAKFSAPNHQSRVK